MIVAVLVTVLMIMTAAVVVLVLVSVVVRVLMIVRAIVRVIVSRPVRHARCVIGAGLGLECRVGFVDAQAHAAQHVGQHMVGLELQAVGLDFEGDVPVAQVIRGA